MQVILYSTHCPKCHVLETKLKQLSIDFKLIDDVDLMESKGFMEAPMLEVDGQIMTFGEAVNWLKEYNT